MVTVAAGVKNAESEELLIVLFVLFDDWALVMARRLAKTMMEILENILGKRSLERDRW